MTAKKQEEKTEETEVLSKEEMKRLYGPTEIVIPKGYKLFDWDVPGIATENIHVVFDGGVDQVAGMLVATGRKELLPLLTYEADGKKFVYTRQGNRVEVPADTPTPEFDANRLKPGDEMEHPAKEPVNSSTQ